jgi:2'-5' RNA ligase
MPGGLFPKEQTMYVWIGCKLPESFETEIRSLCLKQNEALGLDTVAFSLPQHISLKISFETAAHEAVLEALTAFLSTQQPFSVRIEDPAQNGNILWLPTEENSVLRQLHDRLDTLLQDRFDIPQHAFDKAFLFHSTLFIDENVEKISKMSEYLQVRSIARVLTVDTFLLGISETGKAGTYRVVRQIQV